MKTFLITLTIILLASLTNSEAQNKSERENLKTITQLVGNYYSMVMVNAFGETLQEGQYYKEGNKFLEHGIWKLYDYNTQKLITKAASKGFSHKLQPFSVITVSKDKP